MPHFSSKVNNRNVNVNILGRRRSERHKLREITTPVSTTRSSENVAQEDQSMNCTSGKKKNQRYSSSFVGNTTGGELSVDKEFEEVIGNNSKAKRTSSVHMGEDITLCWIETTTIKENKTVRPPKRLVIREYTISFENSATIPDRYLECNRLEGELAANDSEIGKTTLFEVINEDTKVSRTVNFTSVSHIGDIIVWQHKRVKCGVGPVISKNIIEWQDGTKNPKKRVEIKVSPKMHQLTATKPEEEPCTEEVEESSAGGSESTSSSIESCENAESGSCDVTMESDGSSAKHPEASTSEESITEQSSSGTSEENDEEDLPLSTNVVKSSTSSYEELSIESATTLATAEMDESIPSENVEECEEGSLDPACMMHGATTLSSEESSSIGLFITTEATAKSEASSTILTSMKTTPKIPTTITNVDATTEEEISSEEKLPVTTESSSLSEESDSSTISSLTIEETTLSASTDASIESSESRDVSREGATHVPENVSYTTEDVSYMDHNTATMLETKTTTITSVADVEKGDESSELTEEFSTDITTTVKVSMKAHGSTSEEDSGGSSVTEELAEDRDTIVPMESTSKESGEVDHVPSSDVSTTVSDKTTLMQKVTTAVPPFGFTEFAKETGQSGKILDKLSGPSSISTVDESTSTIPSTMSEKVLSGHSGETVILASGLTTIGLEFISTKELIPLTSTTTSLPRIEPTALPPTTSSEVEYSCENSENCVYVSSSEFCDEYGNCGRTTKFCESGECSEEEVEDSRPEATSPTMTETQPSVTKWQSPGTQIAIEIQHTTATSITTTTLISREAENSSTAINNVPTTVETRRSTPLSSMTTTTPRHKLTLKIKVLLEHVNEKKEKQNLVEVEKHLSLNEAPEDNEHPDLLEQLKSLNSSINMETIGALLNCTSLGKLAKKANFFIGKQQRNVTDSNIERLEFMYPEDSISQQLNSERVHAKYEDSQYPESDEKHKLADRRRRSLDTHDKMGDLNRLETVRRNLFGTNISLASDLNNSSARQNANLTKEDTQPSTTTNDPVESTGDAVYVENDGNTTRGRNESEAGSMMEKINNETKMEVVRQILPGIQEDVSVGLQHVVSQLTRGNLSDETEETAKTDLLGIIADPRDDRIHSRRRRAITEEVGRWSNERIRKAPMGGNLRSLTEFTLYKVLP